MGILSELSPKKVWEIFDLICSIPHISKHEAALAEKLAALAAASGLHTERDHVGNLIIKRPAAPGFENAPKVILQAHMDMVPASSIEFDFLTQPITPIINDGWVMAKNTTLGSDDGIGVAHAMAVVLDKEFKCGELTVILTVDEEAGMSGASNLPAEYLDGKYMINLDGNETGFCVGCAGGARQETVFELTKAAIPGGYEAFSIALDGLPGGHSGLKIHENRGNAIKFLAEFIEQCPDTMMTAFTAGTADNAIPYQATAKILSKLDKNELIKRAGAFSVIIKSGCPSAKDMTIKIDNAELPDFCFDAKEAADFLNSLILVPNEVTDFDEALDIVKTSSNLATVRMDGNKFIIRTSQRSLVDADRKNLSETVANHFAIFGGKTEMGDVYPATTPQMDSEFLSIARECAKKHRRCDTAYAVHAGLETGWLSLKNPDLEIISCGPDHNDHHTPYEKLNIASVERFDNFLRDVLLELAK